MLLSLTVFTRSDFLTVRAFLSLVTWRWHVLRLTHTPLCTQHLISKVRIKNILEVDITKREQMLWSVFIKTTLVNRSFSSFVATTRFSAFTAFTLLYCDLGVRVSWVSSEKWTGPRPSYYLTALQTPSFCTLCPIHPFFFFYNVVFPREQTRRESWSSLLSFPAPKKYERHFMITFFIKSPVRNIPILCAGDRLLTRLQMTSVWWV